MKFLQSELFSAEEIESCKSENQEIVKLSEDLARADFYKHVHLPYYRNPKDDNERLLNLQYEWLKNGDIKKRDELFAESYVILKRILWHEMKQQKVYYSSEDLADKIADAFEYIFRRYTKGGGYVVRKNFISALKAALKHSLYYRTMKNEELSLDGLNGDWSCQTRRVFC